MRKLLVMVGLAGVAAAVAKKFKDQRSEPTWHTAPDTEPEAPLAVVPEPVEETPADDAAGAAPDEAIADAAEAPHQPTTPDAPLEEHEV
jgi:hypothetical protein